MSWARRAQQGFSKKSLNICRISWYACEPTWRDVNTCKCLMKRNNLHSREQRWTDGSAPVRPWFGPADYRASARDFEHSRDSSVVDVNLLTLWSRARHPQLCFSGKSHKRYIDVFALHASRREQTWKESSILIWLYLALARPWFGSVRSLFSPGSALLPGWHLPESFSTAAIAQLGERQDHNLVVVVSTPTAKLFWKIQKM